ncbi:MAG TPA: hypothetical protein VF324_06370, partial [Methanobacterium sp.]
AKLANIPSVGILITPADAKVCTKITTTVALPESNLFQLDLANKNIHKSYSPVNPEIIVGDKEHALKHLPQMYDKNLPTILLSSGSTLFVKMAMAASKLGKGRINAIFLWSVIHSKKSTPSTLKTRILFTWGTLIGSTIYTKLWIWLW